MDTTTSVLVVAAVIVLLTLASLLGVVLARRQKTRLLQWQFGPEYDRAGRELGDQAAAERVPDARLEAALVDERAAPVGGWEGGTETSTKGLRFNNSIRRPSSIDCLSWGNRPRCLNGSTKRFPNPGRVYNIEPIQQ